MKVKKIKKPGDQILFRLKTNEQQEIINWINEQSNVSDSIRYLIEQDIIEKGYRDIQETIPSKRKLIKEIVKTKEKETNNEKDKEVFIGDNFEEIVEIKDKNDFLDLIDVDEEDFIFETNEENSIVLENEKYNESVIKAWEEI